MQAEEAAQEATRKAREATEGPEALAFEEKLRKLGFAVQRLPPRDRVADKIQDLENECALVASAEAWFPESGCASDAVWCSSTVICPCTCFCLICRGANPSDNVSTYRVIQRPLCRCCPGSWLDHTCVEPSPDLQSIPHERGETEEATCVLRIRLTSPAAQAYLHLTPTPTETVTLVLSLSRFQPCRRERLAAMRLAVSERPARQLAERQARAAVAAAVQKQQTAGEAAPLQQPTRAKPSRKGETAPHPEVRIQGRVRFGQDKVMAQRLTAGATYRCTRPLLGVRVDEQRRASSRTS